LLVQLLPEPNIKNNLNKVGKNYILERDCLNSLNKTATGKTTFGKGLGQNRHVVNINSNITGNFINYELTSE
jgi:hypothetical protein